MIRVFSFFLILCEISLLNAIPFGRPKAELPKIQEGDFSVENSSRNFQKAWELAAKKSTDQNKNQMVLFTKQLTQFAKQDPVAASFKLAELMRKNKEPNKIIESDVVQINILYEALLETPIRLGETETFKRAMQEELKTNPYLSEYDALATAITKKYPELKEESEIPDNVSYLLAARRFLDRSSMQQIFSKTDYKPSGWFEEFKNEIFKNIKFKKGLIYKIPKKDVIIGSHKPAPKTMPPSKQLVLEEPETTKPKEPEKPTLVRTMSGIGGPMYQTTPYQPPVFKFNFFDSSFIIKKPKALAAQPIEYGNLKDAYTQGMEQYSTQLLDIMNQNDELVYDDQVLEEIIKQKTQELQKNKNDQKLKQELDDLKKLLQAAENLHDAVKKNPNLMK